MRKSKVGSIIIEGFSGEAPEKVLMMISEILGESVVYQGEGRLIMDIKPSADIEENVIAYNSATYFGLHTDMSYVGTPPDYVALYVIKNDRYDRAKCLLCPIEEVIEELSSDIIELLKQKTFKFETSEHYRIATGKSFIIESILEESKSDFTVRYRSDTTHPLNGNAEKAVNIFKDKMEEKTVVFAAPENSLIIYDNKKITHGRTSFKPTYSSNDRSIKRIYINSL